MPPLSCKDFAFLGFPMAMANAFGIGGNALAILAGLGIQPSMVPMTGDSVGFWVAVCTLLQEGAIAGNHRLERLLGAAADLFPGNSLFAPYALFSPQRYNPQEPPPLPAPPGEQGQQAQPPAVTQPVTRGAGSPIIMITGYSNVGTVIEQLQGLAREMGLPGEVEPGYESAGILVFNLPAMNSDQAARLAQEFTHRMEQQGEDIDTTTAANEFRDYLIGCLFVSGPDQARFALRNVPASTRVREIGTGVISQYDPKIWGLDRQGKPRASVVDLQASDGTITRLNPDTTLHENNIGEDATLHVSPESTAGIHPHVREEALVRVARQVRKYAASHKGFQVMANSDRAPTEYEFDFFMPSFAPPPQHSKDPVQISRHQVYLFLPADFPIKAPEAYWQTPIFHPNIHRRSGKVCLGALGEQYRPGIDFGDVCQMLIDIAGYRNYAVTEGYDREAVEWAVSDSGQKAIEEIGGECFIRKLIRAHLYTPRPLEIARQEWSHE